MNKKLWTLAVTLSFTMMFSCSKTSIPVGMKCDYLPYAYGTIITSKVYAENTFTFKLDSLNKVTEVVGDTSINGINYCVFTTKGTTQAGVLKGMSRGVIRCGDGIYQSVNIAGTNTDLKFLPSNPKLGDTWTNPAVTYYGGTSNEVVTNYSYKVVEIVPSMTVQGNVYTNVVKVFNSARSTYTKFGMDNYAYGIYYWDKTVGMIKYQSYTDSSSAMNNAKTNSYEELVSVK